MGGKALQGLCETQPLNSFSKYNEIADAVNRALTTASQSEYYKLYRRAGSMTYHRTPVISGEKVGHSDIDFIINQDFVEKNKGKIDELIAGVLGSKAFIRNGDILSCEFRGHQIDFITAPKNAMALNAFLNGHGGLGSFVRDLLRPYGYKLNRNGLFFRVEYDGEFVADVKRTSEYSYVLNIAHVDAYNGYSSGSFMYLFKTLEQGYAFLYSSPLFTLGAFGLNEKLEFIGDVERLKYPPYAGFIKYIQNQSHAKDKPVEPAPSQIASFQRRVSQIHTGGKEFEAAVKTSIQVFLADKALRKRFSGEFVMKATGMTEGPQLGKFMEAFRLHAGSSKDKFAYYIMSSSPDVVEKDIQAFHAKWVPPQPEPVVDTVKPVESPKPVVTSPESLEGVTIKAIPKLTVKQRAKLPELVKVK